jgi:hypothetical protein
MVPKVHDDKIQQALSDARTSDRLSTPWTHGWGFGDQEGLSRRLDPAPPGLEPRLTAAEAIEALCVVFPSSRQGRAIALFGVFSGEELVWAPPSAGDGQRRLDAEPAWLVLVDDGLVWHQSPAAPGPGVLPEAPVRLQQYSLAVIADLDSRLLSGVNQQGFPTNE